MSESAVGKNTIYGLPAEEYPDLVKVMEVLGIYPRILVKRNFPSKWTLLKEKYGKKAKGTKKVLQYIYNK